MRHWLLTLSASATLMLACGGDSPSTPSDPPPTDPPPPTAPSLSARALAALDVGNANGGSDLLVSFVRAVDHAQATEYRIIVSPSASMDLATALALPADRYRVADLSADTARTTLDGLLDSGGAALAEGQAYTVRVLTIGPSTEFPGELSDPVSVTLANEAAVYTFAPRVVGGTGGVSTDTDGSILMADFVGTVYRTQPDGTQAVVSTGHQAPSGNLPWDGGTFLQANYNDGTIDLVQPDGTRSLWAQGLSGPVGLTRMANGDVLAVTCNNNQIARITPDGTASVFSASNLLACPNSITADGAGNFYVVNFADGAVLKLDAQAQVSIIATIQGFGNGHIIHRDGVLYVTAKNALQIFRVDAAGGGAVPIAGTGAYGAADGPALSATLTRPNGISMSPDGRFIYWNDHLGDAQNAYAAGPSVLRRLELPRQ